MYIGTVRTHDTNDDKFKYFKKKDSEYTPQHSLKHTIKKYHYCLIQKLAQCKIFWDFDGHSVVCVRNCVQKNYRGFGVYSWVGQYKNFGSKSRDHSWFFREKYFTLLFKDSQTVRADCFFLCYWSSRSLDSFGRRVASESRNAFSVTPPCSSALRR